jgi:hypothetical protein
MRILVVGAGAIGGDKWVFHLKTYETWRARTLACARHAD